MQVRKFEAPTMNEALSLVKTELGPDAIILNTKNHRKGFGLLSKASVEITAAISDKSLSKKQVTERVLDNSTKEKVKDLPARQQAKLYDSFDDYYQKKVKEKKQDVDPEIDKLRKRLEGRTARYVDINEDGSQAANSATNEAASLLGDFLEEPAGASVNPVQSGYQRNAVQARVTPLPESELKAEVHQLKRLVEELKNEQSALLQRKEQGHGDQVAEDAYFELTRSGVDRKYAARLLKYARQTMESAGLSHASLRNLSDSQINLYRKQLTDALVGEMLNQIHVEDILDFRPGSQQKIIALIGPTGVGKTTTAAKIAAQAILKRNLRVGMINLDQYRIGAGDQMGTYARILNAPFRHVTKKEDLERTIQEFQPLDLIIIDTSGRSQKDPQGLQEVKDLVASVPAVLPLLVLSTTTKDQDLYDVLNRYRLMHLRGLVMTKLDESNTFGALLNVAMKSGLPLNFFTTGQRVPEDIELASKERVVDLTLELKD